MQSASSQIITEIPSSLKQLARLVVRGFYDIEYSLIVDMLVRYHCMREDDLCDILKFDKKVLRAKLATLKSDKFLMVKLKIETGEDGKSLKMNCWFINYRIFVNIVKYKLDHMRKKMETEERDATSRSSFKCSSCDKQFTDLEVCYNSPQISITFISPRRTSCSTRCPGSFAVLSVVIVWRRMRRRCRRKTPDCSWQSSTTRWRSCTTC